MRSVGRHISLFSSVFWGEVLPGVRDQSVQDERDEEVLSTKVAVASANVLSLFPGEEKEKGMVSSRRLDLAMQFESVKAQVMQLLNCTTTGGRNRYPEVRVAQLAPFRACPPAGPGGPQTSLLGGPSGGAPKFGRPRAWAAA